MGKLIVSRRQLSGDVPTSVYSRNIILPRCRGLSCFYWGFILFFILGDYSLQYSITLSLWQQSATVLVAARRSQLVKRIPLSYKYLRSIYYSLYSILSLMVVNILALTMILLFLSGDVHPNPGPNPDPTSSDTSFDSSCSASSSLHQLLHHLSIVHYNVQSLMNKTDVLQAELSNFDILSFTETWLSDSISNSDIEFTSFKTPERKDRSTDNHGGVIVYIKDSLHHRRRQDLELAGIECIWVEIFLRTKRVLLGVFYRPPSSNVQYDAAIEDSIHLAVDTGIEDIVVTGDFNRNMLCPKASQKIISLCTNFGMSQCVDSPTHFTENSCSLIDLMLISNPRNLLYCKVVDPCLSQNIRYHCPIVAFLKFTKPRVASLKRHIYLYDQGDYDSLRSAVADTDWDSCYHNEIDTYAINFTNQLLDLIRQYIPNKTVNIHPNEPPWLTSEIKAKIRKRRRLFRRAKMSNNPQHWNKFRELRNNIVVLIRLAKSNHISKLTEKIKSESISSKGWWSLLKQFIGCSKSATIPPLRDDNNIFTDAKDKANLLNSFFCRQTVVDDTNKAVPNIDIYHGNAVLSSIELSPADVYTLLHGLPTSKASGPDGISNRILRETANELSVPLCSIFNYSLSRGAVPRCWKQANVCPIFKAGDPSVPSNYRPISLLSSLSKVLERLVFKHLYNHFLDNSILSPLQSGFVPGDCTTNQLTYLYNTFCQGLDNGKEIRVVFCDVSKAFDRVWHQGLIKKLSSAGISGSLLEWFQSYLKDRQQRVLLPGALSEWGSIKAGVPQGSILGPLLFLLYINDITVDISTNIRLFADDTSLYIIVDDPVTDSQRLNFDLQCITDWADKWLVNFNPSKTESLIISRKLNRPVHPPLNMKNQTIEEVIQHKHLGVTIANDCKWHAHIVNITTKAMFRINIMKKLKFILDRRSLEIIYMSFIRPILEYCDVVWNNCTQYEKDKLENIQLEAARVVTGTTKLVALHHLYSETGWETLQSRRNQHSLTLFYKMKNDLAPRYLANLIPDQRNPGYNLRNNNIQIPRFRTTLYSESFLPATIRMWNELDTNAQNSPSVTAFKNAIRPSSSCLPKHFYHGDRKSQVLLTRLRTGCSNLNFDLSRKDIVDSPLCNCGEVEDALHFFLHCNKYARIRTLLLNTISQYCEPTLPVILNGNTLLDHETNILIVDAVHLFVRQSGRFG